MSGHIQKNRILQVTIHAIVWGLIIGLPLFFFEENFAGRRIIRYWDFLLFLFPWLLSFISIISISLTNFYLKSKRISICFGICCSSSLSVWAYGTGKT